MEFTAKKICENRVNGKWQVNYTIENDELEVYRELAQYLIAKKINKCKWIKSIVRQPNYDDTQTIIIYKGENCRVTYIIED